MNRRLTVTLTVLMVGSLMFMGFAGTVAAQNVGFDDIDIDQTSGDATNVAEVNQENNNAQVGVSSAIAVGDDSNSLTYTSTDNGGAASASWVDQVQVVSQSNNADVNQDAQTGDNEVEFEVDVETVADDGTDNGADDGTDNGADDGTADEIAELQAQIDALEEEIATLEAQVDTQGEQIATLEAEIALLEEQIADLEAQL